jgi:hypothetical protein
MNQIQSNKKHKNMIINQILNLCRWETVKLSPEFH